MTRLKKGALCVLTLIALIAVMIVPRSVVRTDAADAQTQNLQDQIAELNKQIDEFKAQISELSGQKDAIMEVKEKLDRLVAATQQKIDTAEQLTAKLDEQIADTEGRIEQKETEIKATFDKFLERMVISYEQGDVSYLSILVNSADLGDFLSRMNMVNSILEYDRNLKIQYQNEKASLEADKKILEDDRAYQNNLIAELNKDKEENELLIKEQETYLATIQKNLEDAQQQYYEAKAQEDELDQQLQALLAEIAARQQAQQQQQQTPSYDFIPSSGFGWPLPGYTYISSGFGWRILWGYQDYHRGIDIPAPGGTPIHASKSGVVVSATFHGSYGNYVLLDNGYNDAGYSEATLYAHMSMLGCAEGQVVNQGDIIGYVGTTGNSSGNHLHFEIRLNGQIYDPLNYVTPY